MNNQIKPEYLMVKGLNKEAMSLESLLSLKAIPWKSNIVWSRASNCSVKTYTT